MTAKYGPNTGLLESMDQGDQWTSSMHVALRGHDFLLQPVVKSLSLTVPPVSPSDGDAYVVATGGSGAWSGHDTHIARWTSTTSAWEFLIPKSGWLVTYSGSEYMFNGTAWAAYSGGSGGSGTVTSIGFSAPAAGMTISGTNPITTTGTWTFAFADDLGALEGLTGTGYARRTGTSTWTTGPVYLSAGAITQPTYTDNGNGSVTIGNAGVALYSATDGSGIINPYTLSGGTFTLTDGVPNYIVGDYNSGSPYMHSITNLALIDNITVVPLFTVVRDGTNLHYLNWDEIGNALANRTALSIAKTNRFRRESGLTLAETTGRVITLTAGVVWYGPNPVTLAAVNSSTDTNSTTLFYHSGGNWTESIVTQYNNTQYDDGSNLQTLSNNSYGVIFVYRGVENSKALYLLLGGSSYTLTGAQAAQPPANVPNLISSIAMLVGRIIVLKGAASATEIDSAFATSFTQSVASNHNDLYGLQGGAAGEYYHLTSAQHTLATQYASSTQGGLLNLTDWNTFNQKEPALGSPGTSGYLLSSTSGGTRSWVAPYSLPTATASVLGGVKPDGTSILNSSGAISATAASVGAEPALGNPATSGYILSSTSAGVRSWIAMGGGLADAPSDGSTYGRKNAAWVVVSGTGTVTGPGSSTDGHIVLFNGTNGQVIKDSGHALSEYALVGQTFYLGTTSIAINRSSASIALTGITSIDGTAANSTNAAIVADSSTNATMYLTWVTSTTSGNYPVKVSSGLTYNPSTGALSATSFNSITGLASVAPGMDGTAAVGTSTLAARQNHIHPTDTSRASTSQKFYIGTTQVAINRSSASLALTGITSIDGTAANATNAAITADSSTNATMYLAWVTSTTSGNYPVKVSTGLTYNPSTGALAATSFNGITGLSSATPADGSTSGTVGTATTVSHGDHAHPLPKVTLTYSWAWETAVTTSDWQPCYQFRQACTLKAIRAFQDSGTSSFTASTITIYKNGSSWKTCNLPASWTSGTWTDISTGLSDSLSSGDYITAVVTTAGTHLKVTLELETEQQAH